MTANPWTYLFLVAVFGSLVIHWLLGRRHIRYIAAHRGQVPDAFADRIPLDDHQKAADYTRAKVRLRLVEYVVSVVLLLIWTFGGGLDLLDATWRSTGLGPLWLGVGFMLSAFAIMALLDLPLDAYRTFVMEQRFGFNKMTAGTFIADIIKNTIVFLIIGTPLLAVVLWIMQNTGNWWWLYVWLTWMGFSLVMMWAYPAFIAPLFNKFRPLEDEALRDRIVRLLDRNGFESNGIFVMDGSARSTHGNAYFTGLGSNKRIVFFDTLLDELSHEEIEAVLAHELGHFKCRHIAKRMTLLGIISLAGLALLGWVIDAGWFYSGLGIDIPSTHMALTLFMMIAPVFMFYLQPLFSHISRQHEFEADDFAAGQAHTKNLVQALVKLYKGNANTLTPDPLYSAFHDSHPPAPIRIAHLNSLSA
ncbi:MAG: M48 family metallopeptidase [Gammaproteobacteria bacterium]|nr:M48 family metallopeptidase [Gammaproteobacteria bacterium]